MFSFLGRFLFFTLAFLSTAPAAHAQAGSGGGGGGALLSAGSVIIFLVSLAVSTFIIYVVTKLFGEEEGIGRALAAAIVGTIVYATAYFLLGRGWLAAIVGGIVWLMALRWLYEMGWLKALAVAVIVWIAASLVGLLLPTAPGPL
jgi:hypothetical protein